MLLVSACGSDEAPHDVSTPDSSISQARQESPTVAVASPSREPADAGQLPAPVATAVEADDPIEQPLPDAAMEPRADEIARTIELETQLSESVQAATAMLDPKQAQELLARADGWAQDGFGCPQGAGREACRQFNLRHLIKEIDNQMRGFKTEY